MTLPPKEVGLLDVCGGVAVPTEPLGVVIGISPEYSLLIRDVVMMIPSSPWTCFHFLLVASTTICWREE